MHVPLQRQMITVVVSYLPVLAASLLLMVAMGAGSTLAAAEEGQTNGFPWPYILQQDREHPWVIKGHVVDSAEKPIRNGRVAIIAQYYTMTLPYIPPQVLGQCDADAAGTFQISIPSLPWYRCRSLTAVAGGDSLGLAAKPLDPATLQQQVEFQLQPEVPVRGKLLGPDGRPAVGVQVNLRGFTPEGVDRAQTTSAACWTPEVPSFWPASPITDDDGNFTLRGLSRRPGLKLNLNLAVNDPRFAPEDFNWTIEDNTEGHSNHKLTAARVIEGTVTCEDTGEPLAAALLQVISLPHNASKGADMQFLGVPAKTDEKGRFKAHCKPGKFVTVYLYPPKGQPYPAWIDQKPLAENPADDNITFAVPRGILVRGRVVDDRTGAGVAGAGVYYHPLFGTKHPRFTDVRNPHIADWLTSRQVYWANEDYPSVTSEDGVFETVVLPGAGHLMVKAPTPDFISKFVSLGELEWNHPAGFYFGMEGDLRIDPRPGAELMNVTIPLRRGHAVSGAMVGPKGEAVSNALLLNPSYGVLNANHPDVKPIPLRNGKFNVSGYNAADPKQVFFLDVEHQSGASMFFDVEKASREPTVVRLAPCGSVTVVLVDQNNRPWANELVYPASSRPLAFVRVEGIEAPPRDDFFLTAATGDIGWSMPDLPDSPHKDLRTDADGRVTFSCLIPGAPLKLYVYAFGEGRQMWREANVFTVEPGQNVDLGTVMVKRR